MSMHALHRASETLMFALALGAVAPAVVLAEGSIVGWGNNSYGQINVPAGEDFTAIEAGGYHGIALRTDRSLAGWGWNIEGQADVPDGNDFIAIAAGGLHNLALKTDGSIVGWGW